MQFRTVSLSIAFLASVAIFKASISQAAPTSNQLRSTSKISCEPSQNPSRKGQLYAGPGYYGSTENKLGYKFITNSEGKEEVIVVKEDENDSTIRLLDNVIELQCNSTFLNTSSHPGLFGSNRPMKLLADVGQDGIPFCIGLNEVNTNSTFITLIPCSETDDKTQLNQFWIEQFKYGNLYPLIGKSNSNQNSNYDYLIEPKNDSNPPVYTTLPKCIDGNCNEDYSYNSFVVSSS